MNKEKIYNALLALAKEGSFYECVIDVETGEMSIDTETPISTESMSFAASEINSTFRTSRNYRRNLADERESWIWIVRLGFVGVTVSFETWEEQLIEREIRIPGTSLFARLSASDYNPPPQASPNNGGAAEFAFQITSESLRK